MDYLTLNKTNLLSFAQNISKSKLLSKTILKHKQEQPQTSPSNLLYSNIIPTKERSRSVNAMMSSLLKQSAVVIDSSKKETSNTNLKPLNDLSASLCTNTSNTEENSTKHNVTQIQKNISSYNNLNNEGEINVNPQFGDNDDGISVISKNESVRKFHGIDLGLDQDDIYSKAEDNENYSNKEHVSPYIMQNYHSYNTNKILDLNEQNKNSNEIQNKHSLINSFQNQSQDFQQEQQYTSQNYNSFRKSFASPLNNQYTHSVPNLHNFYKGTHNKTANSSRYNGNRITNNFIPSTPNYNQMNNNNINIHSYTTKHYNVCKTASTTPSYNSFHSSNVSSLSNNQPTVPPQSVTIIQLEDLIVLEEKLFYILDIFRIGKPINKICVEWWTFYTYSSFNGTFETLFQKNSSSRQIAHTSSILELLSIILLYEILKDQKVSQTTLNLTKNLINEIHQNFLIISDLILSRINAQAISNIWINKIQNIILTKRSHRIYKNEHLNILKKNNDYISNIFRNIIRLYTSNSKIDSSTINFYFRKIQSTSVKTLNDYFRKKINQDFCKNGESLTFIINESSLMVNIPVPYLQQNITDKKIFTLVLDLDETLISFRKEDAEKGILRLRPYLNQFLTEIKPLYELIVFTAGTQEYADPILDAIEKKGKFFDKRLYRQHAVIIDNVFVKDLSKLGRDLSKVIIIDNMPHNFKLQKENGIFIKNFYGDDKKDQALLDLIPILKSIASNEENDVRQEMKKFEQEIFTKITTDLKDDAV